jgi:putative membrane protein
MTVGAAVMNGLLSFLEWCPASAHYPEGGWHMMPGMGRWSMGMGWLGMLLGIAFWILVFLALVYLVKYLMQTTGQAGRPPAAEVKTPLDILKERYARGEIDKEEFEAKKRDLAD